jgi:hypothetical protein
VVFGFAVVVMVVAGYKIAEFVVTISGDEI